MDYTVHEGIAQLSFNRPERANALDLAGWHSLREAFTRADRDAAVRVVILRGSGRNFCGGMDVSVLHDMQSRFTGSGAEQQRQVREFIADLQDCITAIERCRKPVIAAVHGACIGGGVDIITACDLRFCVKNATFSIKEIDFGIVADLGTLQRMPQLVNPGVVAELAFTGRNFDGKEAARIGLVNEALGSVSQLEYRTGNIADMIATKPPKILAGIKQSLLQQRGRTLAESLPFVAELSSRLMTGQPPEATE